MASYSRTTKTVYVPVSHHVYFDGHSFRVRGRKDNNKTSKNFPSKQAAIRFRDEVLFS